MHFTYTAPNPLTLCQGDLLQRTEALNELLKAVHPHYHVSDDYHFFSVVTQTCDLVRRDGATCEAHYITIAAVRPFRLALQRQISQVQRTAVERRLRFASEHDRAKLVQFLERLLNNNEPEYFFYSKEPTAALMEDHCAFLRLTIAVKADKHYETLLNAKVLQLTESFQHKLGFLVGNMYARVGTEDWAPDNVDAETFRRLSTEPLDDVGLVLWIDKDVHKKLLKALRELPEEQQTTERMSAEIKAIGASRDARRREAYEIIAKVLGKFPIAEEMRGAVMRRLESSSDLKGYIK